MNKSIIFIFVISLSLLLNGCSKILEPMLLDESIELNTQNKQEEFSINIKPLNFNTAKIANQSQYNREIMRTGSGLNANVFNETKFLKASLPKPISSNNNYLIGINDKLSYVGKYKFLNTNLIWPTQTKPAKYLLGPGDELMVTRQNIISEFDEIISTTGIIGDDGNILLLELGNINLKDDSLRSAKNKVRNIFIRKGLDPNFQLEITKFNSQKAYITTPDKKDVKISINNLPITLREVVLSANISKSLGDQALITLSRDKKEFLFTTKQLFNISAPEVYIQNKDKIEIQIIDQNIVTYDLNVDTNGNILLPRLGKIKVENKSIAELENNIKHSFSNVGIAAEIQIDITSFNSKKLYFVDKNKSTLKIKITDKIFTLRDLIFNINAPTSKEDGLIVFTLRRDNKNYRLTGEQIMDPNTEAIYIQDGDQIEQEDLTYKPGKVFALGGYESTKIININPSVRETLADVLFSPNGTIANKLARRSEVYLLRGKKPSIAYHLNAQNVSRVLVAAHTELRPNDIIFVAERPIISFSRALSELNPLRVLLRDIDNNDFP